MIDVQGAYDPTARLATVGIADQISANVYDAGTAKKVFGGNSPRGIHFVGKAKITVGTGVLSFRARVVSADNALLTTNPVIIADTGVQTLDRDGTALAIGDEVEWDIPVQGQRVAKRYYGVMYNWGTADQNGEVTAVVTIDPQTNMLQRKLAVP